MLQIERAKKKPDLFWLVVSYFKNILGTLVSRDLMSQSSWFLLAILSIRRNTKAIEKEEGEKIAARWLKEQSTVSSKSMDVHAISLSFFALIAPSRQEEK